MAMAMTSFYFVAPISSKTTTATNSNQIQPYFPAPHAHTAVKFSLVTAPFQLKLKSLHSQLKTLVVFGFAATVEAEPRATGATASKSLPFRIGHGFDLHRLEPGYPLNIGDINIPHDRGCEAHSNGDVLLHCVVDAILDTLGLPDISQIFPNTDPKWKGAASSVFFLAKKNLQSLLRQRRKNKAFLSKKKSHCNIMMSKMLEIRLLMLCLEKMTLMCLQISQIVMVTVKGLQLSTYLRKFNEQWVEDARGSSSLSMQNEKIRKDLSIQKKKLDRLRKKFYFGVLNLRRAKYLSLIT